MDAKKTAIPQQTECRQAINSMLRLLIATRFAMIVSGLSLLFGFPKFAEYMAIFMIVPFLWMTYKIYMSNFDWLTWKSTLDERLLEFRFGMYAQLSTWIPLFFIMPSIHSELSNAKIMLVAFTIFCVFSMMIFELRRFSKLVGYFSGEK